MAVDDREEQDGVVGVKPVEQALDRRAHRVADAGAPGHERRDEEDRRLVPLGLDEELHARRLHGAARVGHERREVERLHVEPFEVLQDGGADVRLAHARLAADDHAGAEDAQLLER